MSGSMQTLMDGYLADLLAGGDFARHFTEDVTFTTMESGEVVSGRQAVRDYIVWMHRTAFDAHPDLKALAVTDEKAFLEVVFRGKHIGAMGSLEPTGADVSVPYVVVYDLVPEGIRALRVYMSSASLVSQLTAVVPAQAGASSMSSSPAPA
jgi:hypothetical protein